MAITTPATNILQSLDVLLELPTQGAFHHVVRVNLDRDGSHFLIGKLASSTIGIDRGLLQNGLGGLGTYTVDVLQRVEDLLVFWDVDAGDTRHSVAPLVLDRPAQP
jgi:hypothetical protein